MRVIVCGSREWTDYEMIDRVLSGYAHQNPVTVVHGGARGADALAGLWARNNGVPEVVFPADWKGSGKAAGPLRNKQMLASGADRVLAFKDGFDITMRRGGTEHMVSIAIAAGVITIARSHGGFFSVWSNEGALDLGITT